MIAICATTLCRVVEVMIDSVCCGVKTGGRYRDMCCASTAGMIGNVEYKKGNNLAKPNLTLMSDDLQHFLGEFRFCMDLYGIIVFFFVIDVSNGVCARH